MTECQHVHCDQAATVLVEYTHSGERRAYCSEHYESLPSRTELDMEFTEVVDRV